MSLDPTFRNPLGDASTSGTPDDSHVQPGATTDNNAVYNKNFKSVPVYKWNLKFKGKGDTISFNSFLEQVDEYCKSRNVDKVQLFNSARDLFEGDALRIFNMVSKQVNDWENLVRVMKEEYVASGKDLWKQILRRTQNADESIAVYVATMCTLFDRMPNHIDDHLRLQILRDNIRPRYQKGLALTDIRNPIKTPFELIDLCRRLDITDKSCEEWKLPQASDLSLEPDLACSSSKPVYSHNNTRTVVREVEARERTCWRCHKPGHVAKFCRGSDKTQSKCKCFTCGKVGFTKRNCPNCNSNDAQGNGPRRQ